MRVNPDLDTIIAYQIGSRYTFLPPDDTDSEAALVVVRLVAGAWLERSPEGETVVCTHSYRFGARLMTALALGLCTVEPLPLTELEPGPGAGRAGR